MFSSDAWSSRLAGAKLLSAKRNGLVLRSEDGAAVIKLFNSGDPVSLEEAAREMFFGAQFHAELLRAGVITVNGVWTLPLELPPHVVLSPLPYGPARDWTILMRQPQASETRRAAVVARALPPPADPDAAYAQMMQGEPPLAFVASEQPLVSGVTLTSMTRNASELPMLLPIMRMLAAHIDMLQGVSFQHGDLSTDNVIVRQTPDGRRVTTLIDCARASMTSTGTTAVPTGLFIGTFDMRMLGIWFAVHMIGEQLAASWDSPTGRALRSFAAALVAPPVALVDLVAGGGARTPCSNNYMFVSAADHLLFTYVERMIAVADHLLNSAQANTAGMLALATGLLTDYGPWMRTLAESHPATLGDANDLAFPTHTQRFDVFAA